MEQGGGGVNPQHLASARCLFPSFIFMKEKRYGKEEEEEEEEEEEGAAK